MLGRPSWNIETSDFLGAGSPEPIRDRRLELQTKVKRRFAKISQTQRMPQGILLVENANYIVLSHLRHYAEHALTLGKVDLCKGYKGRLA